MKTEVKALFRAALDGRPSKMQVELPYQSPPIDPVDYLELDLYKDSILESECGAWKHVLPLRRLAQGEVPRFELANQRGFVVLKKNHKWLAREVLGEEMFVPSWDVAANPVIKHSAYVPLSMLLSDDTQEQMQEQIESRKDFAAARAYVRSLDSIGRQTDQMLDTAFRAVAPKNPMVKTWQEAEDKFAEQSEWAHSIIMSARVYYRLKTRGLLQNCQDKIRLTSAIRDSTIFFCDRQEKVGAMVERESYSILPACEPKKLRRGLILWVGRGIAITDCNAIRSMRISSKLIPKPPVK
jgi:hypothetical protein